LDVELEGAAARIQLDKTQPEPERLAEERGPRPGVGCDLPSWQHPREPSETAMDYDLKRPCPNCPFRRDRHGFLNRAPEIAQALRDGGEFACHQTTVAVEGDDGTCERMDVTDSKMCAGALAVMERDNGPNQMMRIAERLGMYDHTRLDPGAPVFDSLAEFVAHHEHNCAPGETPAVDRSEPCAIAEQGCEAPCGYGGPGGVVENPGPYDTERCVDCDEPVCRACSDDSDGERRCVHCQENAAAA
jgi:hypothetical protein